MAYDKLCEIMRVKLKFKTEKGAVIPFNHQYYLSSAIYNILNSADRSYSKKLHNYRGYKFFTFSLLNVPKRDVDKNGIITKNGIVYLHISSPNSEFLTNFIKGLLKSDTEGIFVGNVKLMPDSLTVEELPKKFDILKTISPIYLKTVVDLENGDKRVYDLLPNEEKFYENFKNNLKRKYEMFYNVKCDYDFNFEVLKSKQKRVKIKNTFHRCSELVFKVEGDYELIKFGYDCGFGEKNSMGFGMCRV
jgi:CRISPR-associated endoribonuclease Cas6